MQESRVRNTTNAFIWNLYNVVITSLFPFLIRTLLIRYIGLEYTGISSLFTSIMQIVNLADLGFESAICFFLYRSMAGRDDRYTGSLLHYLKSIYHKIGVVIFVISILLLPVLHLFIYGQDYPKDINLYIIFIIYIFNAVMPYFAGYYSATVFKSDQRADVLAKIGGTTAFIMYAAQIVAIVRFQNFYVYTLLLLVNSCLLPIMVNRAQKKKYPEIKCEGWPEEGTIREIKKKVYAIAISKIRNVSRNSFDSVVISSFVGLSILTLYQNYYQVMLLPNVLLAVIHGSVAPSLGNGFALESKDSNYGVVKLYAFLVFAFSAVAVSCLVCLFQPFITLWLGKDYLLDGSVVWIFAVYFQLLVIADIAVLLREVTGIWWQGRYVAVAETAANLILSVILVQFVGYIGVIIATIISILCINIPFEFYYVFKNFYKEKLGEFLFQQCYYVILAFAIGIISYVICGFIQMEGIIGFGCKLCSAVAIPCFLLLVTQYKNEYVRKALRYIKIKVSDKVQK